MLIHFVVETINIQKLPLLEIHEKNVCYLELSSLANSMYLFFFPPKI